MSDALVVTAELAARQIYWRIPLVEKTVRRILARRRNALSYDRDAIFAHLQKIGVQRGSLVMLHSSIQGITSGNYLLTAQQVLSDLLELVGPDGTVVMPTHPYYPADPGFMHDK